MLWCMLPGKIEPQSELAGLGSGHSGCFLSFSSFPMRLRARYLCLGGGTPGEAEAGGRGGCSCLGWRLLLSQWSIMGSCSQTHNSNPLSPCDSQGHPGTMSLSHFGGARDLHIEKLCFASLDSSRGVWGGPWQPEELPLSCVKEHSAPWDVGPLRTRFSEF